MVSQTAVVGDRLTADIFEIVHLRDGPMMDTVVSSIRKGGANCVYVVSQIVLTRFRARLWV